MGATKESTLARTPGMPALAYTALGDYKRFAERICDEKAGYSQTELGGGKGGGRDNYCDTDGPLPTREVSRGSGAERTYRMYQALLIGTCLYFVSICLFLCVCMSTC